MNATKKQDGIWDNKTTREGPHELLKFNWCHFKVPKWHFEISNLAL